MKTLLTAVIALTLSGAAIAQNEVPQDTIPGYAVTILPASGQQLNMASAESRNEPLEYSVPGYGVTASAGRVYTPTEVGSSGYDYLGMAFEGNQ